jgi:hypothetical protein
MNKYLKIMMAVIVTAVYLLALRYVLPPEKPYFILSIAVVGYVAWLLGTVPGLVTAILMIPISKLIYDEFTVTTSYMTFATSPAYLGLKVLASVALGHLRKENKNLAEWKQDLTKVNAELQESLANVQELGGVHNLCGDCKKIQTDNGSWHNIDGYLADHSKMEFSHCICPDCAEEFRKNIDVQKPSAA